MWIRGLFVWWWGIGGHPYITSSQRGGLPHWWRLMTRGEGGSWTWWRHQEILEMNINFLLKALTFNWFSHVNFLLSGIQHYQQSCCSVIILICIYYCIIHGLFQFHSFCRQTFIDISDFTTVEAHREIEISIFTDDVILGGRGLGAWWRLMTRGREVENGLKIDDVIYGWPLGVWSLGEAGFELTGGWGVEPPTSTFQPPYLS